ncbi:hypothetical protein [Colwellia sp. RSH04]|uniref:hypothetical protein n=1 Tax=Colwellia sp. RSH04 TaxID=2305464 RepID=UPI000E58E939|nr:hypothetical protein [Colwellia sp. RSH04]RHW76465.1 hypothetical protein D1094_09145 [Colwellia sp. RSH04]
MDYSIYKLFERVFAATGEALTIKHCTNEALNRGHPMSSRTMARYLQIMEENGAVECINPEEKPYRYKWLKLESTMTVEEALLLYPYIKHGHTQMPNSAFGCHSRSKIEQALQIIQDTRVNNPCGKIAKWLLNEEVIDQYDDLNKVKATLARVFNNAVFDGENLNITYRDDLGLVSGTFEPDAMQYLDGQFYLKVSLLNSFQLNTIKLSDVTNLESVTDVYNFEYSDQIARAA